VEYKIIGTTMPLVEFALKRNEKLCSQAGAMKWMTDGIRMETSMSGGFLGAFRRKMVGESAFLNYFTAEKDGERIAFGHTFPGHIIPIDVSRQGVICQRRAFLCSTEGVQLDIAFQKKFGAGFFGGEGFIMERLSGNGLAFVEIDGESVEIGLKPGQRIKVETGAVGMYEETVQFSVERVKGFTNMLFGGEGLFLTTLVGPGKVWLQTMPIQSMVAEMSTYFPRPSSS
jgi:uncharacterized protein (TIGR00266 family)